MPQVAAFTVEQAMTATQRMMNVVWRAVWPIQQSSTLNLEIKI